MLRSKKIRLRNRIERRLRHQQPMRCKGKGFGRAHILPEGISLAAKALMDFALRAIYLTVLVVVVTVIISSCLAHRNGFFSARTRERERQRERLLSAIKWKTTFFCHSFCSFSATFVFKFDRSFDFFPEIFRTAQTIRRRSVKKKDFIPRPKAGVTFRYAVHFHFRSKKAYLNLLFAFARWRNHTH